MPAQAPSQSMQSPQGHNPQALNPLDQLKDIHLPDAISWWPLAPGWWVVIALTIAALWWAVTWYLRHRRRNAYRQFALKELTVLTAENANEQDIILLLRRTAISSSVSHVAMDKSVKEFLISLNNSSKEPYFDQQLCLYLNEMAYQANPKPLTEPDRAKLVSASKLWIKKHSASHTGDDHVG